jgi:hypothetical protein
MPCFDVCRARRAFTARKAKPLRSRIYTPSAVRPWSQSATWVRSSGYRIIEARSGRSHSGASGAGQLTAGRVGGIIARRELKHPYESGSESKAATLSLSAHESKPLRLALPARATKPLEVAHRSRATDPPGLPPVLGALTRGVIGASGAARGRFALRPRRLAMYRLGPV